MNKNVSYQGKTPQQMRAELTAIREGVAGVRLGRSITIGEYCAACLGAPLDKVLHALDVNLSAMSVQAIVTSETGINWLYPEAVQEAVYDGFTTQAWESNFLASEVPVNGTEIRVPSWTLNTGAGPHETQEGETFRISHLMKGSRSVHIRKIAEAMEITYEAVKFSTVAEVMVWTKQYGVNMSAGRKANLVDRLVNGDQVNGSMAAAVIGVLNVNDGFTWRDYARLCARMGLLGFNIDGLICDEDAFSMISDINEFKRLMTGAPLTTLKLVSPLPAQLNVGIHTGVGAGRLLFNAKPSAVYQGTAIPFMVETDKNITSQVNIQAASITADLINIMRGARVIVDPTLQLTPGGANDFPAWMTPIY